MTKNLETADRISKLALSILTIVFYSFNMIDGPFAVVLLVLSVLMLVVYLVKGFVKR